MNIASIKADRAANMPECLYWGYEEVANWIAEIGFPKYKECFRSNFINGRKLITVTCSTLPNMGVTDYHDIVKIMAHIREKLDIPMDNSLEFTPFRNPKIMYLQQKSKTGSSHDNITYNVLKRKYRRLFKN